MMFDILDLAKSVSGFTISGEGNVSVRDGDEIYERKDGKIKYNGNWYVEGSDKLPWEQRAIAAEKYA